MKKNGFTLLEILVSVGVLATVATLIAQVLFTTTRVGKKTDILADIKQNGNFTLDIIGRTVRSAAAVKTSCDEGAVSAPSAQIVYPDGVTTTLTCASDGNAARIASISATGTVYLSGGSVTVSSSGADCTYSTLAFSCPPALGIQNEITVAFTLAPKGVSAGAPEGSSAFFQVTMSIRN